MPVLYTPQHRGRSRPRRRRWGRTRGRLGAIIGRLRRVSLLVRFGVLSAVLVGGLGTVLAFALADTVEKRALAQAEQMAASVAILGVQHELDVSDFEQGRIAPDRLVALDDALDAAGSDAEVLRIKVFDRDGTLLYSDEKDLIGEQSMSDGLAEALSGGIASEIEAEGHEASERDLGALLEVYVPVRMETSSGTDRVVGAFEMYLAYGPIAQGVAADVRQLLWCLALGLVALWAGLFQVVTAASRRLRQHAQTNEWLARHDTLTGLPNRALFTTRAAEAVRTARRSGIRTAVLLVDVDRFKEVNDTLGHHIGDALLRAIGDRLRECRGDGATVARLSSDEYAVLLTEISGTADAEQVAGDLLGHLRAPVVFEGMTLEVDASVGVAVFPDHADSEGELLQRADVALYHAKADHDGVVVYRPEFDVHTPARLALFGELRRAIDTGQLLLHYQPKVDLVDGRVTGVEALVRWRHPQRGLLLPTEFIPVAEQTGLIRPMTLHLLDLALRDCRAWRDGGLDLSVAVNLSARSLVDADLPEQVDRMLVRHALPSEALELEITETTAMVDPGRALAVLHSLRALGVRLSVDDYGTGHSSLAYLHRLPLDTLKIDKSFVQNMDSNPHEATIVRSTIDMARSLGLQVVAEGVETEASWNQLGRLGCDAAQGYWLARPGTATDVPDTISALERRLRAQTGGAHDPVGLSPVLDAVARLGA